jgi:hypothetical protein
MCSLIPMPEGFTRKWRTADSSGCRDMGYPDRLYPESSAVSSFLADPLHRIAQVHTAPAVLSRRAGRLRQCRCHHIVSRVIPSEF